MDDQIQTQLDKITQLIKNDNRIIEMKELRNVLFNDEVLINKITRIQSSDNMYDSSIIELKKELYNNQLYSRYINLENDLYFLTLEINQVLNRLTDRKGCSK